MLRKRMLQQIRKRQEKTVSDTGILSEVQEGQQKRDCQAAQCLAVPYFRGNSDGNTQRFACL